MEAAAVSWVERDFVFVAGVTTQLTFPVSIVDLGVDSDVRRAVPLDGVRDIITGDFFGCEGPLSTLVFHTERLCSHRRPVDIIRRTTAICRVGTGCSLIDAGLNLWTLDDNWVIRRNGQTLEQFGYSDWLLSFGGQDIRVSVGHLANGGSIRPSGWGVGENDSRYPASALLEVNSRLGARRECYKTNCAQTSAAISSACAPCVDPSFWQRAVDHRRRPSGNARAFRALGGQLAADVVF
jgi:hypothetical protein